MDRFDFSEARVAQYEFKLDVKAPVSRVWHALISETNSWWLPSFRMLGESSAIELEPHGGGRLIERADSRELLWYTVIAIDAGKSIDFAGYCTSKYGGPSTTMLSIEFTKVDDERSQLRVSDSLFGRVTDDSVRCTYEGWMELLNNGLKRYCESRYGA